MALFAYPSVLILLAANALPLWFVLDGRWDAFHVLLGYWWEGLIIAVFAILKVSVIRAQAPKLVKDEFDIYDAPRSAYIGIAAVLSLIDLWIIGALAVGYDGELQSLTTIFATPPGEILNWIGLHAVRPSVLVFAFIMIASHAFSWYSNFLIRKEFVHVQMLLDRSVIRVVVPQLLALMLALVSLSASFLALWSVVVGKTLADVLIHLVERMTANPGPGGRPTSEAEVN